MVFLRLEVRVYPRESVQNAGLFSTVLGKRPENEDANGPKKTYAGFLLTLENPEDYTLGDLSYLIKEKWHALRPQDEPLVIKKLLDETMPSIDLEVGMSVADVFVDRGKALADGHDQRGILRVIQKPNDTYAPVRFSSVVQDFEGASESYARRKSIKPLDQILEDPHDTPISSVEISHEAHNDGSPSSPPFISNGPVANRDTQLVNTGSPRGRSRKRKQSTPVERETPAKEPRVELTRQSNGSPSQLRKSNRISSFASPNRRLSYSQPTDNGLGLGITGSPKADRTGPPHSSPHLPAPQSILSKSSKNTPSDPKRRISFADNATPTANGTLNKKSPPTSAPSSRPERSSRQGRKTSLPSSSQNIPPPSSQASSIIYPAGLDPEKLRRIQEETLQREKTKEEARELLQNRNANKSLLEIAKSICDLEDLQKQKTVHTRTQKIKSLVKDFQDTKDKLASEKQPENNSKDKEIHDSEDESSGSSDSSDSSEDEESGEENEENEDSEESEEEREETEDSTRDKFFDLEAAGPASAKDHGSRDEDTPMPVFDSSDSEDEEMADSNAPQTNEAEKEEQNSAPEQHKDEAGSGNEDSSSSVSGDSDSDDQEMVDPNPTLANAHDQEKELSKSEQHNKDAGSEDEDSSSSVSGSSDKSDSNDQKIIDSTLALANGVEQEKRASKADDDDNDDDASRHGQDSSSSVSGNPDSNDQEMVDQEPAPVNGRAESQLSQNEQQDNAGAKGPDEPVHYPELSGPHDQEPNDGSPARNNVENSIAESEQDGNPAIAGPETGPAKETTVHAEQPKIENKASDEDDSSDSDSGSDSDSDSSDYDPNFSPPPLPGNTRAKPAPAPVIQERPAQSRPKTLKELLQIQKAEQAARKAEGNQSSAKPSPAPAPKRRAIFSEVDSSDTETSDEDSGDIHANGTKDRIAKPRVVRH